MAIDAVKDDSVVVFMNGLDLYNSPPAVEKSMTSGTAEGSPLPIIASFDASLEKEIGVVPYRMMRDKDGFNTIKAALAEHRSQDGSPETAVQRQPEMWKDSRGRTMRATYVNSADGEVTFLLKNGKHSTIPLSDLSEASQKRIAELAQE